MELYQRYRTQLETVQGTAVRIHLQSVWTVPRDNKVTINRASSLGPTVEGSYFDFEPLPVTTARYGVATP